MRCHLTDDVDEFLDEAGDFLHSRPVEHNLVLSIAHLSRDLDTKPSRWAWAADDSGDVVGAFIQSPATFAASVTPMPAAATQALVTRLSTEEPDLPAINGEAKTVALFAGAWASARRIPAEPVAGQRLYQLGPLRPPGGVAGHLRRARTDDVATLIAWDQAFNAETGLERPAGVDRPALIARRANEGHFWVWETDNSAVSQAYASPSLADAARIGAVYTPPEHRGHGYASASVAGISAELQAAGAQHCLLYTQLTNPTSNGLYQRIGFAPLAEILVYRFGQPAPAGR